MLSRPPTTAVTENFSEDDILNIGSSSLSKECSLGESRKLEGMNKAEDDGFEDVGNSAELMAFPPDTIWETHLPSFLIDVERAYK